MTFSIDEGRITIFRSTLETLGWPSHYRFLYNPQMNQIAVQACKAGDTGAHRVGKRMSSAAVKSSAWPSSGWFTKMPNGTSAGLTA